MGWGRREGGTGRVKWQTIRKVNKKARLEGKRVAIKARVIRETKGKAWAKGVVSASRRIDGAPPRRPRRAGSHLVRW